MTGENRTRSVAETRRLVGEILAKLDTSKHVAEIGTLYRALNNASVTCPGRKLVTEAPNVDATAMLPLPRSEQFVQRAKQIAGTINNGQQHYPIFPAYGRKAISN